MHPSSNIPRACPLYPKPPFGFLCGFSDGTYAPLFAAPVTPSLVRAVQLECPANPQQHTSTGSQRARWPWLLHCSTSSWYLASSLWWASSMCSSQGTMISHMITCWVESEKMKRSGRSLVCVWCNQETLVVSYFPRSTLSCQSGAIESWLGLICGRERGFSPALSKWMVFFLGWCLLDWLTVLPWAPGRGVSSHIHRPRLWGSCWGDVEGILSQHTEGRQESHSCPMFEGLPDLVRFHRQLGLGIWSCRCQPARNPTMWLSTAECSPTLSRLLADSYLLYTCMHFFPEEMLSLLSFWLCWSGSLESSPGLIALLPLSQQGPSGLVVPPPLPTLWQHSTFCLCITQCQLLLLWGPWSLYFAWPLLFTSQQILLRDHWRGAVGCWWTTIFLMFFFIWPHGSQNRRASSVNYHLIIDCVRLLKKSPTSPALPLSSISSQPWQWTSTSSMILNTAVYHSLSFSW